MGSGPQQKGDGSEERVEHASLQTSALSRDFGHLPSLGAPSRVKERRPDGPTEAPAAGGAAAGDLHADHELSGRPLRNSDLDERGGGAAGVAGGGVEQGLPRPLGDPPLPDQARLLRHPHPAEVAEGEETGVLQALLAGEAEEDGDEAGNGAAAQQQLRYRGEKPEKPGPRPRGGAPAGPGSRSHDHNQPRPPATPPQAPRLLTAVLAHA